MVKLFFVLSTVLDYALSSQSSKCPSNSCFVDSLHSPIVCNHPNNYSIKLVDKNSIVYCPQLQSTIIFSSRFIFKEYNTPNIFLTCFFICINKIYRNSIHSRKVANPIIYLHHKNLSMLTEFVNDSVTFFKKTHLNLLLSIHLIFIHYSSIYTYL